MALLDKIPMNIVLLACLTLGMAPFFPEPHVWEKLKMLVSGGLIKPVDMFDLAMHAAPFVILATKLLRRSAR